MSEKSTTNKTNKRTLTEEEARERKERFDTIIPAVLSLVYLLTLIIVVACLI